MQTSPSLNAYNSCMLGTSNVRSLFDCAHLEAATMIGERTAGFWLSPMPVVDSISDMPDSATDAEKETEIGGLIVKSDLMLMVVGR